ncbi:MAG TPA: SMP-30/gluconolactonase/LRE family protein [Solirubrobacteraceae bacterium]|jgi:sugar lactone lactonase YvrE|nr:SMP-30/gluconolactonase/LRE family protein [Solirubrobacteraceae bacterium]
MSLLSALAPVEAVLEHEHSLLEAPRFDSDGGLVYSDVIAGGVWSCSAQGELRELLPKRRGIGGIVAHREGGWVISGRDVIHLASDGEQRVLLAGEGVSGYNDLATTRDGDLLAGVLRYRPLAGEPATPGQLVRLAADGEVRVLSEEVVWPNGIGVSPDGETVYVSDYARELVLALPAQGGRARELCHSPRGSADGLAVDAEGGIWVALGQGAGVARFSPDGALDDVCELPASFISSLCFGGADMREVLISTADNELRPERGGTLLRARSGLPGLPVEPARA